MVRPRGFAPNPTRKLLEMKLKLDCLQSNFKTFKNFNQGGFPYLPFYCADSDVAIFRATISGCSEPNPVERDLDNYRFSPLPDRSGKTSGLCPKPHLGDFLRRSPLRTFKTFTAIGFMSLSLRCTDFECSRLPCYESRLLRAKSRRAGFGRLSPLPLPDRSGRNVTIEWNGTTRGSFPTDYAPAGCVILWK